MRRVAAIHRERVSHHEARGFRRSAPKSTVRPNQAFLHLTSTTSASKVHNFSAVIAIPFGCQEFLHTGGGLCDEVFQFLQLP
jgi:hypothetical protein